MDNELTSAKDKSFSASDIGDYIHQIAEIEKDIFTMEETVSCLKKESEELKNSKKELDEPYVFTYEKAPYTKKPSLLAKIWNEGEGCFWLISGFGIAFSAVFFTLEAFVGGIWAGIICAFIIAVSILLKVLLNQKAKKNHDIREAEKEKTIIAENRQKIKKYEAEVAAAEKDYAAACKKANAIDEQIKIINNSLVSLKDIRNKLYSLEVIPPDYRTMDCVYGLNYIFRNDLADTVRDAILLYEDRVYKGEVIKGMGLILSQLKSLDNKMTYLTDDIHAINRNIAYMSQDISLLLDTQLQNSKTLKSILNESKATKYATETIQRHSEEAKKYYGY